MNKCIPDISIVVDSSGILFDTNKKGGWGFALGLGFVPRQQKANLSAAWQ
jgi:hypothetical protein